MTPPTTATVIGLLFVAGVVYDVIAYCLWGNDGTISKAMQLIGLNWPIVIVACGGLCAHFFLPKYSTFPGWWTLLKPALCLLLGMVAFAVAWQQGLSE
jgi:hypothetical protein